MDLPLYFREDCPDMLVLLFLFLVVVGLTVNHFVERCQGVKILLLRDGWLIAVDTCSNSGSNASKRVRTASITYEILGTSEDMAGEDFQNIGTFVVVRSSVFAKSSAQKTHLARDAYNAYSQRARGHQVQFFHWCNRWRKTGAGACRNCRVESDAVSFFNRMACFTTPGCKESTYYEMCHEKLTIHKLFSHHSLLLRS